MKFIISNQFKRYSYENNIYSFEVKGGQYRYAIVTEATGEPYLINVIGFGETYDVAELDGIALQLVADTWTKAEEVSE